jgi:hypothetical protein
MTACGVTGRVYVTGSDDPAELAAAEVTLLSLGAESVEWSRWDELEDDADINAWLDEHESLIGSYALVVLMPGWEDDLAALADEAAAWQLEVPTVEWAEIVAAR